MELCVDNPREGFADLFATHPSVPSRVDALVKFAGGHDPGPLALAGRTGRAEPEQARSPTSSAPAAAAAGRGPTRPAGRRPARSGAGPAAGLGAGASDDELTLAGVKKSAANSPVGGLRI